MKLILGILLALLIPITGIILRDAPVIWPVSVLIYNLGLLYSFALVPQKIVRVIIYSIVAATFFLTEASFFFSYYLQNTGFNDAFFYHLRTNLLYAGVNEYLPIIIPIIVCLFGFLIISSSYLARETSQKGWKHSLAIVLLILGLFISPPTKALVHHVYKFSTAATTNHDSFADFPELKPQQITAEFSRAKRPNIVLIYAESLNQGYFDEDVFPDLLPNLRRLRDRSIDFSNVSQGVGASWTMGGIVASQCGYPLTSPLNIDGNNLGILDEFLPRATCLGDLLKKDGYNTTFIGGADARFAGKVEFLLSHGYDEVLDRDVLLEASVDQSYYNKWGAFDDTLFDFAIQKFILLSRTKSPFLLTLLTLDTHEGYLSRSCGPYGSNDSSMLNAFHCSDQLISGFIEQIRNSVYSDNTLIIVVSDHLEWANQASDLLKGARMADRLTFFVNTPEGDKSKNTNPGLHYDIAPTILDLIGYNITGQIGFGSSLARGEGYLQGKFGENEWQKQSANLMAIGEALWNNEVTLDQKGIRFRASDLSLTMGGREFDLPRGWKSGVAYPWQTIFIFDEKSLKLEEIKTSTFELRLTPITLGKELLKNKEKLVLVVSLARYLPWFYGPERGSLDEWVFFFGKPGGELFSWAIITGDFMIPPDMINELSRSKMSGKIVLEREKLLNALEGLSSKKTEK